jgi:hypothetical protein
VARLYHRLLAAVSVMAWVSLATQIQLLIGSRGLLPVAEIGGKASFWEAPSLFVLYTPSDGLLVAGAWLGAALGAAALLGIFPRVLIGVSTLLYLTYVVGCRTFCQFQWDSLLIECGVLAAFLPRDRAARWIHILFRLLLFKLYFESGLAKWQSPYHDWQDGSAMTYYYETAPLPTPLAWVAHHLPLWWHLFESRATLVMELLVPFAAFGGRPLRIIALVLLSLFQVVNLATANYGFFVPLALILNVFLLDEADVERLRARFRLAALPALPMTRRTSIAAFLVAPLWLGLSLIQAVGAFHDPEFWVEVRRATLPFRVANTYHLFRQVTRERIEPQFQLSNDGETWVEHDLRYKPGEPDRAPPFVAPHQPRVDFQLWFYGLDYQRGTPAYVQHLLEHLCTDPAAVAPLFASALPDKPKAVRILFYRYHMGKVAWWTREPIGTLGPIPCP